jgi:predicted esterase
MVYAGFSQGAMLAAPYLVENAARFPVAAIAEGGYDYLADAKFARDYHAAGGRRIMILCGTGPCFTTAQRAKAVLEKAGLGVIVAGDPLSGHNLNTRMQNALRREWHNLVTDLPGWNSFAQHRWPPTEP